MDDRYRKHILNNVDELIRNTKYHELINECEHKMLLSKVMRSQIDNLADADDGEKHRQLFIKLTKRGPTAYDELTQIVINLQYTKAATILHAAKFDNSRYISMHNPGSIIPTPIREEIIDDNIKCVPEGCYPSKDKVDSKLTLESFTGSIPLPKPLNVKKSKVIHYDRKVPLYPMRTKNRGVFFMVNIIDFPKTDKKKRSGAEVDGQFLVHLFQEMGFTCFPYKNLSRDKFFEILSLLRTSHYLEQTESFVMALMSHGEMADDLHDRVEFHDGSVVKVKEIEDCLSNDECKYLRNKPKVLIFPFCRGMETDKGVLKLQTDSISYDPSGISNMATRSDMLVCYASVRGFQALRDPDEGSWYIQTFCEVLAENAHDTHLEDMLKLIAVKMKSLRSEKGHLQTPAYYNHGFSKLLFFNPGAYEDQAKAGTSFPTSDT